jgi:hypothetical protein
VADTIRLTRARVIGRRSLDWLAWGAIAAALLLIALSIIQAASKPDWFDARDFELYRAATSRWLGGGPFYEPYQLAGPYEVLYGAILYPPVGLLLFVPFMVLPTVLWWAIPVGITAWVVRDLRPDRLGLVLIALAVAWPPTIIKLSTGNPVIWIVAAVALGVRFGWPAVLVLVKPTLAPFALIGIRRRTWWIALAGLGLVSLPFGAMWIDWLTSLRNARGESVLYSITDLPMVALPIIADIRRTTPRKRSAWT